MNNISFVLFPQATESSMNSNISKMVCTPLAPIKHFICPAKFYITFVFHFSWVLQPSDEKLKTILMQNKGGGGQIRCIMGDVQVAYSVIPFKHSIHTSNSNFQFRSKSSQFTINSPQPRGLFATIVYTGRLRPKGVHQRVRNSQVELCESVGKSII